MEDVDNTEKGAAGERFVNKIAFNSFLKYWCYPGPLDIVKDNKEICDLLIVFKNVCLIISVKNYSFKGNYERYFRTTTQRAIRQILGAEKTLFRTDPVMLVHPDRPSEEFDKTSIKNVYRLIINLNTSVKVYQTAFFEKDKEFVVMDAEAWESALNVLDTLPDFLNYIKKRFLLTNKGPAIMLPREEYDFSVIDAKYLAELMLGMPKEGNLTMISGSELDLIATYYENGFQFPSQLNNPEFQSRALHLDGAWKKFIESGNYQRKKMLEEQGYFVDEIVKEMIINTPHGDKLAKMLFSLNRAQRSFFAGHFLEFLEKQQETKLNHRPYYYAKTNPKMVFLYFKDEYDEDRLRNRVNLYLMHMSYLFDYSIKEIGLIGRSHSSAKYVFGYINNEVRPDAENIRFQEELFKDLNLKLKNNLNPNELNDVVLPYTPLFESPF